MIALLASAILGSTAVAQNNQSQNAQSSSSQRAGSNQSDGTIRVTRASNFIGADVTASDGRKVGDITDYIYDVSSSPHLKYVVVMTGGFMGYGGESRAVPAEAISTDGDSAKLSVSSDQYWSAEILPNNRERFLRDRDNVDELATAFNVSTENRQGSQQSQSGQSNSKFVSFSDLQNSDVSDRDGNRLGRFVDTWVSLDRNRAPYVEISSPPNSPFEVMPRHRFAVPMNRLQAEATDAQGYRLDITESDLRDSKQVSDLEGVKLLQSGEVGDAVLRVRLAQR